MERPKLTKSQSTLSEASADGAEDSRDPNSRSNSDDEFGVAFAPNAAAPVAALPPVTEVRVGKFAARKTGKAAEPNAGAKLHNVTPGNKKGAVPQGGGQGLPPRPQAPGQGQATRFQQQQQPPQQQQQQQPQPRQQQFPQHQPQQQQHFQHQPQYQQQQQYPPQQPVQPQSLPLPQQQLPPQQQQQQFQLQHPSPSGPLPPPLQTSFAIPPHGLAPGSGGGVHAILTSPPPARTHQMGSGGGPQQGGIGEDWGPNNQLRRSLSAQDGGYAVANQPHQQQYAPPGLGSGGGLVHGAGPGNGEWRPLLPGDALSSPVGTGAFLGSGISASGVGSGYGGHSTATVDGSSGQRLLPYARSHHSASNLASLGHHHQQDAGGGGGGGGSSASSGNFGGGSVGSGLGGGGGASQGGDWFVGGDRERAAQLSAEPTRLGGGGERRAVEIQGLGQGRTGSGHSLDGSESGGAGQWYENEAQQAIDRWSGVQRALAVGQSELQSFMLHHLGRYQQQWNRMQELERRVAEVTAQNDDLRRENQQLCWELGRFQQQQFQQQQALQQQQVPQQHQQQHPQHLQYVPQPTALQQQHQQQHYLPPQQTQQPQQQPQPQAHELGGRLGVVEDPIVRAQSRSPPPPSSTAAAAAVNPPEARYNNISKSNNTITTGSPSEPSVAAPQGATAGSAATTGPTPAGASNSAAPSLPVSTPLSPAGATAVHPSHCAPAAAAASAAAASSSGASAVAENAAAAAAASSGAAPAQPAAESRSSAVPATGTFATRLEGAAGQQQQRPQQQRQQRPQQQQHQQQQQQQRQAKTTPAAAPSVTTAYVNVPSIVATSASVAVPTPAGFPGSGQGINAANSYSNSNSNDPYMEMSPSKLSPMGMASSRAATVAAGDPGGATAAPASSVDAAGAQQQQQQQQPRAPVQQDPRQAHKALSSENERGQVQSTPGAKAAAVDAAPASTPAAKAAPAAATATPQAQPSAQNQASATHTGADASAHSATPPSSSSSSPETTETPRAAGAAATTAKMTTGEPIDRTVSLDYAVPLATMFDVGAANSSTGNGAVDSAGAAAPPGLSAQNTNS